jgi:hypothetical protein
VLAARLTARDRWILRMLAEHRVLTTDHLRALAFAGSLRYTQTRLRHLAQLGLIASFRRHTPTGSVPSHWVLQHPGRVVLAAEDDHPAPTRDTRQVGRGLALAHNRQLAHQLGVNTCLTYLATATGSGANREASGPSGRNDAAPGRLELWWGQARCTRHFPTARPDAYAVWATGHPTTPTAGHSQRVDRVAFFLEYDSGTETLARLSWKLVGYHHLAASTAITTPLLVWLPTPGREHTARHALTAALAALPHPRLVPVATAHPARGARPELGWDPEHPTWSPLYPPEVYPPAAGSRPGGAGSGAGLPGPVARVSVTALAGLWPLPRHTHHGRVHHGGVHGLAATANPSDHEIAAPPPTPPTVIPIRRPRAT